MKRLVVLTVAVLTSALIFSCSPKQSEMVVADLGPSKITMEEFEKAYANNVGGFEEAKDDSLEQYKNFLDLYSKFRMKLRDAKVRGYENDPDLQKELNNYKKSVGVSYLKERKIVEKGIKDLYEKRKEELRVSHIMIRTQNRSDEEAKQRAEHVIRQLKEGKKFSEMARLYSDDQFSKDKGGDIYYITAGMIVPEFEEAAYKTKVGEIYPEPVKTRFGYHVIKVTERQKRVPEIKAKHILIKFTDEEGKADTLKARQQIESIRNKIVNGEAEFSEMARKYSDDKGSGEKGGNLGYFSRRNMVLPFDKAAFSLDEGEISDIVKTRFGFHLIKVTDKKEYPPFKQVKDQLRKMYKKTRLEDDVEEYVNKLKEEFNFTVNDSVLTEIESANDTIKFSDNYIESDLRNSFKNAPVFTVNKKDFPLDSLVLNVQNKGKFKNKKITKDLMEDAIDEYSDRILLEQKAMGMVDDDPKFADLMKEYKNGIFVFKLQEDEVWNKMEVDSTDLYNYYQANKENYMYPERVNFSEIYSRSDSLINDYYAMLKQGANFDTLAAKFTERQGMREKAGNYGLKPVDFNAESKKANELSVGHYSEPFKVNRGWAIVKLKGRKQPSIMPFEEARPEVASDYQEVRSKELEEKYVESLKKRYNPKLYYEKLESAYKSEESESKE